MPVVQPFYSAEYDIGTPAIVSFWSSFMGLRSQMHKQVMASRLARADPSMYNTEITRLRESIADLHKINAQVGLQAVEGYTRVISDMTRAAGQERKGHIDAAARQAVARIEGGVRLDQMESKERLAIMEMLDTTAAGAALDGAQRNSLLTTDRNVQEAEWKAGIKDGWEDAGVTRGAPRAENIAYDAWKRATDLEQTHAANIIAAEHFPGIVDVGSYMTGKYAGLDKAEAAARRAQTLSPGGLPARGGDIMSDVQQFMGMLGGAGGAAPATGQPVSQGGPTFPSAGAPGLPAQFSGGAAQAPAAAPRGSALGGFGGGGFGAGGFQQAVAGEAQAGIGAQISGQETELRSLMAKRAAAQQTASDPFAGYTRNYLLETPFLRGPDQELQDFYDHLATADPVAVQNMLDELAAAGGDPIRAEAEGDFPFNRPQYQQIPQEDAGEYVYAWLGAEAEQVLNEVDDESTQQAGFERLMRLVDVVEQMPEELKRGAPDLVSGLDEAWSAMRAASGETRLVMDDDGKMAYAQAADGTVAVLTDTEGARLEEPYVAEGDAHAAITAMIGPHPAASGEGMREVGAGLYTAVMGANDASRDDVLFSEALSEQIGQAMAQPEDQQVLALQRVAQWTESVPTELGGRFASAYTESVNNRVQAGDGPGLYQDVVSLYRHGFDVADQRETFMPKEARDRAADMVSQRMQIAKAETLDVPSVLKANEAVPFVQRMFDPKPPTRRNRDGTVSTHLLATAEVDGKHIVYPTLRLRDGGLVEDADPMTAMNEGNVISFDDAAQAEAFAQGAWKPVVEQSLGSTEAGRAEDLMSAATAGVPIDRQPPDDLQFRAGTVHVSRPTPPAISDEDKINTLADLLGTKETLDARMVQAQAAADSAMSDEHQALLQRNLAQFQMQRDELAESFAQENPAILEAAANLYEQRKQLPGTTGGPRAAPAAP